MSYRITGAQVEAYAGHLRKEERSESTIEKYLRDIRRFLAWLGGRGVSKETVHGWKESLLEESYAPVTVNSMLSAVNGLLRFLGREECRVKFLRIQRRVFRDGSKVFPHNLRHLFATTFYKVHKDIVKLADVLGHSSVNTTRIYLVTTGDEYARQLDRLGLVI